MGILHWFPQNEATAIWLERGISVVLHLGLRTSVEIFTVFIKTQWGLGDSMATAALPIVSTEREHRHLQQQSTGSRHDGAGIVFIDEGNRVQSEEQVQDETPLHGIIGS